MRVTALVENTPLAGSRARGEHGLALLLEVDGRRVLFDTGASGLLARNARVLRLASAVSRLDAIVLSHGHYDHAGGLAGVLRTTRACVPVFIRPGAFERKVRRSDDGLKEIGMPLTRRELESLGARIIEEPGPSEVFPGMVHLSGEITREATWEDMEPGLCVEHVNGRVEDDPFIEEQALAVRIGDGIAVVVGCAHRGLVNSIAAARRAAGNDRVRAVFGGAHLRSASRERIERTVEAVARLEPELVVLGHCTGHDAEEAFARAFGERFQPLRAGGNWTI